MESWQRHFSAMTDKIVINELPETNKFELKSEESFVKDFSLSLEKTTTEN